MSRLLYTSDKDGLLRQEILRQSHHNVAHLKTTEKNFAKYCESASKLTKLYFAEKSPKQILKKRKRKNEISEEKQFQFAVQKGFSNGPVDVIYIEDIEAGKVLVFDPPSQNQEQETNSVQNTQEGQPNLVVSSKCLQVSEFFPKQYNLKTHREIDINLAIRRIKYRARVKAKSFKVQQFCERVKVTGRKKETKSIKDSSETPVLSSSSDSESDTSSESDDYKRCTCDRSSCDESDSSISYSSATSSSEDEDFEESEIRKKKYKKILKNIYNKQTEIGDAIIQDRFVKLKCKKKIKYDEESFYRKVCEITELEKEKSSPRFKKIQDSTEYKNWVSGLSSLLANNLDEKGLDEPMESPDLADGAIIKLMQPSSSVTTDFHRAVAFVKKAKIYTKQDFEKNVVIFGGLMNSCLCKNKKYPFQDTVYVFTNATGEKVIDGLEERKVDVLFPTITLLPHLFPNLKLSFVKTHTESDF